MEPLVYEFKVIGIVKGFVENGIAELEKNLNEGWKVDKVDQADEILVYILSRET